MSYIGVDYGTKRVGIAVSDEGNTMAFPAEVVPRGKVLEHIVNLVKEREAHGIVIGESKNFHGEDNAVMTNIRTFADDLREKTGVEVIFEPEFLTSAAAKSAGASAEMLDASAAAFILQSFLDRRRSVTVPTMNEPAAGNTSHESPMTPISIDEFKKLQIRVGEIVSAEKVENADKLLRLMVSFGEEKRQIVSGIFAYFPDPTVLAGKKVAFAYNLEPRVIRGIESQGMILAAMDDTGNFSLLEASGVRPGASVR
jgi:putative transcription antitermination factor YqgF